MAFTWGHWTADKALAVDNMNSCLLGWGPIGDFPAAATYKGMIAMATDETNKLYYSTGAAWAVLVPNKRMLWCPATLLAPALTALGSFPSVLCNNGAVTSVYFSAAVPTDFGTLTKAVVIIGEPGGTGNIYRQVNTNWVANGEDYTAATGQIAYAAVAVTVSQAKEDNIAAALSGIAGGDYIGVKWTRDATNASDTDEAACYVLGLLLEFS